MGVMMGRTDPQTAGDTNDAVCPRFIAAICAVSDARATIASPSTAAEQQSVQDAQLAARRMFTRAAAALWQTAQDTDQEEPLTVR
ncbi:MAG: hypothetical protein ACYC3K_16530 [Candidatus Nanopelagicales bacterium]